jgi:hypothetical protein
MLRNYKHILPSGIPFEMVVISDENYKLVQNYKCKICENLVVDARDCSICQDLYCNDCSRKVKEECKTCRNGKTLKPLSKREREILKDFQIRCVFKDKGCKDIIGYGDYIEHIYNCPSNQIKIEEEGYQKEEEPNEINDYKVSEKFDFHVNNNNSTYKMTDIYNPSNFTKDKVSGWKCSFCSEKLKESGKTSHILSCEKFEIKCKDCSKPIKRIKYPFHNHGRCFMKMLNFYEKFRKQGEKLEEIKKLLKSYESKGEMLNNNSISDINMSCEGQRTKKLKKSNGKKKKGKKESDSSENEEEEEEKYSLKSDKEEDEVEEEENDSFLKNKRNSSKSRELEMREEFKNIRNDISLLKDISKDKRKKNKNKKYLNDYIH